MSQTEKHQYRAWQDSPLYKILCDFFPRYYSDQRKLNIVAMARDLGWSPLRIYRALRGTTLARSTMLSLLALCCHYVNADLLFKKGMRPEDLLKHLTVIFKEGL